MICNTADTLLPAIAFLIAFAAALWLHPKIVTVARCKGITDNPDKRKLQREPVPVLGGIVVFFGIVLSTGLLSLCRPCPDLMLFFALMLLMLYTGALDDILGLSPATRLLIELLAALALICIGGYAIRGLYGLWGVERISLWAGVPLTVVTVVGIINAINLIDGVNGLSSGYCIMACALFGIFFREAGDIEMTLLAAAAIGALIPFFVHNVFGNKLRMFIGDSGTLMMGMALSLFVLRILNPDEAAPLRIADAGSAAATAAKTFARIPFTLAVLSIAVFDTLRVMTMRVLRGTSPFHPDQTHLHHAFIGLGLSHLQTTASILGLNLLIVALWFSLYRAGASDACQIYAVVAAALILDTGSYFTAKKLAGPSNRGRKTNHKKIRTFDV